MPHRNVTSLLGLRWQNNTGLESAGRLQKCKCESSD
nr:MAG TPA: hypothetical protein [Caudoviricetes sp.]